MILDESEARMEPMGKVLITGSAGRIGQAAVRELGPHGVRGFDRVPTPGLTDFVVGDLTDPAAVARAMEGVTTLVHLAATPDDADFLTGALIPVNGGQFMSF